MTRFTGNPGGGYVAQKNVHIRQDDERTCPGCGEKLAGKKQVALCQDGTLVHFSTTNTACWHEMMLKRQRDLFEESA